MRFPDHRYPSTRFVPPLGGWWRDYPVGHVSVGIGPTFEARLALFDTGSDDTIFPLTLAHKLGIDLSNAPAGEAQGVGGISITFHYAPVRMRLTDGLEFAEWSALVGFAPIPMQFALLGRTGFHQFFDVTYRGEARETVVLPTPSFPGVYRRR